MVNIWDRNGSREILKVQFEINIESEMPIRHGFVLNRQYNIGIQGPDWR